jgi:23S rRNA (cytosine1962-C5)-methyltransferase
MPKYELRNRLRIALTLRENYLHREANNALRLFAGFYEGCPELVVDLYNRTLVLYDYHPLQQTGDENIKVAQEFYLNQLSSIRSILIKRRHALEPQHRNGLVSFGGAPDSHILEHGIKYAINLTMNQDASFYLDTEILRGWLQKNARDWKLLNTFAYTGSLGIAALSAGADSLIQTDQSKKFLKIAQRSAILNHLDLGKMKLIKSDFYRIVSQLKKDKSLFDGLILDPPFFSSTKRGKVDLVNQSTRLINKVRPLVKHNGSLIVINNAIFLNGDAYLQSVEDLCQDGYMWIEDIISIPAHITGFPESIVNRPPVDPNPFNHPTKILKLRIKRKN